ncbi:AMP-binding protein [Chitinispirillales bacterium ANBcel5]|uniref:class I adenylate-forming enzyme family protein n=1 Tax=Cellulosispirillum alkaliphilum TaxID=3039283 RepID=UPI002A588014|nr:AMP-binding protein [Chitinispirillales bacterium ANBcel5]
MNSIFNDKLYPRIFFNERWYEPEEVRRQVEDFQRILDNRSSNKTPFVYLFAENNIKTLIAYLAVIRSGRVAVLLDPALRTIEIAELKEDTAPGIIIRIDSSTSEFNTDTEVEFTDLSIEDSQREQLKDVCTVVYTAAEDGYAKGVMLTAENLYYNALASAEASSFSPSSISCVLLPYHHLFALQTGLLAPIVSGASIVVVDISDLRRVKGYLEIIKECNVTHLYSIPVLYYLFSAVPKSADYLKSIKFCVSGGAKLPEAIFNSFLKKTGIPLHEGYGLTEAAPVCSAMRLGDEIKIGRVGRPSLHCEIAILDEQGNKVPVGTEGEVCVKGKNVMKGYYKHPEQTRTTLRDGWLHTGDLGIQDADGFLTLTGLKKRMLNVGGKNVYPAEVERFLKMCPFVENAKVYSGESRIMGDTVTADISLNDKLDNPEEEIRNWCNKNYAAFKIPKQFNFVD